MVGSFIKIFLVSIANGEQKNLLDVQTRSEYWVDLQHSKALTVVALLAVWSLTFW
jgi:hypothetical protein